VHRHKRLIVRLNGLALEQRSLLPLAPEQRQVSNLATPALGFFLPPLYIGLGFPACFFGFELGDRLFSAEQISLRRIDFLKHRSAGFIQRYAVIAQAMPHVTPAHSLVLDKAHNLIRR
jgi:hypothetical protein